ncbi:MAG: sulfurtransferase TusA family protein [Gammaproteobacteria bacterium]|nr:sulfurtransferase TusA family protein [Gammaproteobacteria bacterium]MXY55275.1 sulfurtransferase TusA family protein [Gammaproteobacteria bacterium]MYF29298.1 sulfurtransferase TusA family protein [Gammaproteobacteria bacterium]MYK46878.1 sulfurtransferase TusA family protein [Gammaproteobacteria bacterium]
MSGARNPPRAPGTRLDARGLLCPLPVIRTQDKIRTLKSGEVLEVVATDPGVLHDIPAWCRVHGHRLLMSEQRNDGFRFHIEVA